MRVLVTAHLDGVDVISRRLEAMAERFADVRPAWPAVVATFRAITRQTFASEGATSDFGEWEPLAPRTIAQREKLGYPGAHPILRRSGALEDSLTSQTGDSIIVQQAQYLGIGTAVPYVVYHQSVAPRTKLPRRPVVALTADQRHEVLMPLRQWLTGYEPTGRRQTAKP